MLKEKYLGRVTCDDEIPVCAFLITLWTHNNLTSYVWITYFLTERMNKSILHIMKLNEWAKFKYCGTTSVATLAPFLICKTQAKYVISEYH